MANPDAVGTVGTPYEMDVTRGKIREFARATRSENPDYLEGDNNVSPPTFLMNYMFWAFGDSNPWPKVELDQQRGLHAEQEFTFHGEPPRAGTTLEATSRIDNLWTKQGRRGGEMTFVTMVTDFRDAEGNLVAEVKMTGVETARPPAEEEQK
ncbi:MAG: MaoC family dehydratase [Propionibacterium sp.]|nr:MaoC family dehydratase [Propionibacterium sp.]